METTLLPFVTEFFTKLGIATTSITIDVIWEDINISIATPDSALLIGMHGKNIEIFQHLLSRMIERKTEKFIHVHLEVNDYMKLKDEKLCRFLDSKIAMVTSTWRSIRMPSLTSYERKKAHGYIADKNIKWLKTQSEWEGLERALILSYTWDIINPIPTNTSKLTNSISQRSTPKEILLSEDGIGI